MCGKATKLLEIAEAALIRTFSLSVNLVLLTMMLALVLLCTTVLELPWFIKLSIWFGWIELLYSLKAVN